MTAQVLRPDPMLADNEKTVEFLIERAGDDRKKIAEIEEWGKRRQARIEMLCRLVGLLAKNGVFGRADKRMNKVIEDFATTQCFAIGTRYGLDGMGYIFSDSQSGPLSADLSLDLQAVKDVQTESPTGLFASPGDEARFLEAVRGKDIYELGRMARLIVIDERCRITPLNPA